LLSPPLSLLYPAAEISDSAKNDKIVVKISVKNLRRGVFSICFTSSTLIGWL